PFTMDLFCDIDELVKGNVKPASNPLSPVPYQTENTRVMQEVIDFCPELSRAFIPFVCVDPARKTKEQVEFLCSLEESYSIYGIKVNPVLCQSKIKSLMDEGACFLEFARERDIPFLFHVNPFSNEEYSSAEDAFKVIEKNPDIRFCAAHCILFHEEYLVKAENMENVWVDTAALKIQVQLVNDKSPIIEDFDVLMEGDYSNHISIMRTLAERFPDTLIWGTDSPAYSYICTRKQGEGNFSLFNLKAEYGDEAEALNGLSGDLREKVGSENARRFLFGE
ncbi:amidohydrolase family protein, partial [Planctomycetota bacterium]